MLSKKIKQHEKKEKGQKNIQGRADKKETLKMKNEKKAKTGWGKRNEENGKDGTTENTQRQKKTGENSKEKTAPAKASNQISAPAPCPPNRPES